MKTLKLLTITALLGTLSISTLNAQEKPHERVEHKKEMKHDHKETKKASKVKVHKQAKVQKKADKKPQVKKQRTLEKGDRGLQVKKLQRALKKEGLYRGKIDGIFGKGVKRAVKKFQRQHKLYPSGKANAKTLRVLYRG